MLEIKKVMSSRIKLTHDLPDLEEKTQCVRVHVNQPAVAKCASYEGQTLFFIASLFVDALRGIADVLIWPTHLQG